MIIEHVIKQQLNSLLPNHNLSVRVIYPSNFNTHYIIVVSIDNYGFILETTDINQFVYDLPTNLKTQHPELLI